MPRFLSRYVNYRIRAHEFGRTICFSGGELVTNDEAEAAFIRKHPDFGTVIFEEKAPTADTKPEPPAEPDADTEPNPGPDTDEEPADPAEFPCSVCGKSFGSRQALTAHMRAHKE